MDVYCKKLFCYTDNINRKGGYSRGDQMNAAQRIRLIRIIEKIEKNLEFSNKLGVKNTFDFISDKQKKMNHSQLDECQKEKKDVIIIIYYLYDLVCWKIFYIWLKSILGNHEIILYGHFLSCDINWNGGRRINVYSFSAIDHWWNYRTCNVTFLKRQGGDFNGI